MKISGIKTELVRAGRKHVNDVLIESLPSDIEDGVLKVKVPLTPLPEPKKIAISAEKKK